MDVVIAKRRYMIPFILLFAFALATVMVEIIPVSLAADEATSVKVQNKTAAAGDRVNVDVVVENNPGILGATLEISYSPKLELVNGRSGGAFSALTMTRPGQFTSPCKFVWDGQEISGDDIKDGTILTLTFLVSESVLPGEVLPISVTNTDFYDTSLKPLQVTAIDGSISIGEELSDGQLSFSSGEINDHTISVSVSSLKDNVQAILVLAGYEFGGRQMECQLRKLSLSAGDSQHQFTRKTEAPIYKTFLLDMAYRPYCPALTITETPMYTVAFVDYDGTELSRQSVPAGEDAVPPTLPDRSGFAFAGWSGDYTHITGDCTLTAQYIEDTVPTIVVSNVNASPGDTEVEVAVSIRNNPGVLGMRLTLSYDDTVLTLKSAANGAAIRDVLSMTRPGQLVSPCNFVWDGEGLSQDAIRDGQILTLRFDVADSALAGTYPITLSYTPGDVTDNNLNNVALLTINNGSVVVK